MSASETTAVNECSGLDRLLKPASPLHGFLAMLATSALRTTFVLALGLAALASLSSCAATVEAPERVEDPASVFLFAGGRHCGLLLPCADGRIVEYGYGDWGWYALGEDDWWRAPATML